MKECAVGGVLLLMKTTAVVQRVRRMCEKMLQHHFSSSEFLKRGGARSTFGGHGAVLREPQVKTFTWKLNDWTIPNFVTTSTRVPIPSN